MLASHQVFSILADVIPLWACEAVLAFHDHSHHDQLLSMPEWRTANEPESTHHVNTSSTRKTTSFKSFKAIFIVHAVKANFARFT